MPATADGARPVIALLTDFGLADPYVGHMRLTLASCAPGVPVLDISHDVPPYAVATGALFLARETSAGLDAPC